MKVFNIKIPVKPVVGDLHIYNLPYRLYLDPIHEQIGIETNSIDLFMHCYLRGVKPGIGIDTPALNTFVKLNESVSEKIGIKTNPADTTLVWFASPDGVDIGIDTPQPILNSIRYRQLYEHDPPTLVSMDIQTLADLDYEILV